jgi:hypothetical protein
VIAALLAFGFATAVAGEPQPAPAQDAPVDVVERLGNASPTRSSG